MMLLSSRDRAHAALQRITRLNAEQQDIYRELADRNRRLTSSERHRLHEIVREIALAQDERNRARCGAPPAPPDYDPLVQPAIVEEDVFDRGERGYRKTSRDEVSEMRRLFNEGHSTSEIRRAFPHLKESTIRDILKNRTWHDPEYVPRTQKEADNIREVVQKRTRPDFRSRVAG
jgi:hypothetical protein